MQITLTFWRLIIAFLPNLWYNSNMENANNTDKLNRPLEIDKELTEGDFLSKKQNIFTHMIYRYEDPGLHHHAFIEFFYVLDGSCIHFINNKSQTIQCGDACLLTPGDTHRFLQCESNFLHRDIIFRTSYFQAFCDLYSPNLFNDLKNGDYIKSFSFSNRQINRLEELIHPIVCGNDKNSDLLAGTICSYIINTLIEHNAQIENEKIPAWISRLISLLSAPENFKIDQQKLIDYFSYSHAYICRTFKKTVGKTITDYFNEQKLKYAYSLLQSSDYSIEQICERINFSSIPHFYRIFHHLFA